MRAFVAIDISDQVRRAIAELLDGLRPLDSGVRWSRPEGLHVTLKFLGEISAEQAEAARQGLAAVRGPVPFPVAIRGAGYFPNERAPRVVWLGVEAGPELAELAGAVEAALSSLGFPKENRPFSPHLTLARLRAPGRVPAVQEALRRRQPVELGTFEAAAFHFYESKPAAGGTVYQKIADFPLAAR